MTEQPQDLDRLRQLVRGQLALNGKHGAAQTITEAAVQMGCTHSTLSYFLNGKQGISVEMAIRLAKWLGQPRDTILRMGGHAHIANLLAEKNKTTPAAVEISKILDGLPANQQRALVAYIREMVKED